MSPSPGEVYIVDLGMVAKERPMVVVSRFDPDAPRALSLCAPFTSKNRDSLYEVGIGKCSFMREPSWVNVQGMMAVGNEKLLRYIGKLTEEQYLNVKKALKFARDL
jgi:mRNA interferase MazF